MEKVQCACLSMFVPRIRGARRSILNLVEDDPIHGVIGAADRGRPIDKDCESSSAHYFVTIVGAKPDFGFGNLR